MNNIQNLIKAPAPEKNANPFTNLCNDITGEAIVYWSEIEGFVAECQIPDEIKALVLNEALFGTMTDLKRIEYPTEEIQQQMVDFIGTTKKEYYEKNKNLIKGIKNNT